jgi:hypothetical protein
MGLVEGAGAGVDDGSVTGAGDGVTSETQEDSSIINKASKATGQHFLAGFNSRLNLSLHQEGNSTVTAFPPRFLYHQG